MRTSTVTLLGLLALFVVRFFMQLSGMPEVVASHFGPGGQPDGWMSRSVFAVFGALPVLVAAIVGFLAPAMTARMPTHLINLPHREYWLAPERRAQALGKLRTYLEWTAAGLVAFFIFTYELVFAANRSHTGLAEGPFIAGLVIFMGSVLYSVVRLFRQFALPRS